MWSLGCWEERAQRYWQIQHFKESCSKIFVPKLGLHGPGRAVQLSQWERVANKDLIDDIWPYWVPLRSSPSICLTYSFYLLLIFLSLLYSSFLWYLCLSIHIININLCTTLLSSLYLYHSHSISLSLYLALTRSVSLTVGYVYPIVSVIPICEGAFWCMNIMGIKNGL